MSCGKELVSEPRRKSPEVRSAAGKKSRKRRLSPKPTTSKSKRKRSKRSKFVYSSSSSLDGSETSSSDVESDSSSSSSDFEREKSGQLFRTDENGVTVSQQVLDFDVSAVFQGLSKSERKNLAKEAPVPHHADLRPRFIKEYFKRKGISFNPSMDRRQLNLAARILDPIGPLTQLWEAALAANEHQTGLDPSIVVEFVRQALVGNASFCGLSDRRESLLAKVSPECLDLLDETNLFEKNSADLFGKKFKKAMLKEFQHDKIMDGLFGRNNHGNPGKARAFSRVPMPGRAFVSGPTVRKTAVGSQRKRLSGVLHQEQNGAINRTENNSRYFSCFKRISGSRAGLPSSQPTAVAQTELLSRLKIDFHAITRPARLAGRLAHFVQNWSLISSDPDVLAAVVGYKLVFTMTPIQTGLPPVLHFSKSDSAKINADIQSLKQKGALKQVPPESDQFLSNLFLVHAHGTSRPVINLKCLNSFLQYPT